MKIAVVGAGPAGSTAAYHLQKMGHEVTLFEGSDSVGGLSKSFELWGQTVDLGPHRFFSSERRINEAWLEVVGQDYEMVDRLTRIYYKKKFFHYPLKPFNALKNLGIFTAVLCVISYFRSALSPNKDKAWTFENWVVGRFGRRLYEIFFKTYSEKLWGIPCSKLDADFAAQRIKKLSLFGAIWNAFMGGRGNKHKTLVDQFAYPHGGTGRVYEKMSKLFRDAGGKLELNCRIKGVRVEDMKIKGIETEAGESLDFDEVITTMPLTHVVESLPNLPEDVASACRALKFRNTILVYLEVDSPKLFPDNWLYIHSPGLHCGRITNFRNWTPDLYGESQKSILCLEFWANFDEPLWAMTNEELGELSRKELEQTGLIGGAKILNEHVIKIPRSYPVYSAGYKSHLDIVVAHLRKVSGLTPIGRYGSFKYNNQDHSILMGLLAAEKIGKGVDHDLWDINTDDGYQEQSTITAAGLEFKEAEA